MNLHLFLIIANRNGVFTLGQVPPNDHIKVIHHHLARPFVRRYSNFSNSVGQMYLPTLFYLVKVVVNYLWVLSLQIAHHSRQLA